MHSQCFNSINITYKNTPRILICPYNLFVVVDKNTTTGCQLYSKKLLMCTVKLIRDKNDYGMHIICTTVV